MLLFLTLLLIAYISIRLFLQSERFGRLPSGERLIRIEQSKNYSNQQFQNLSPTPALAEGVTYTQLMKEFIFGKSPDNRPKHPLTSQKTNLHALSPEENVIVWFGHSSYFVQVDGLKILVDPVFSGHASPFAFSAKSYTGADVYRVEDIPALDYLFISHDHWDHLDYHTVKALKSKVGKIITGLGTGEHLERWGYPLEQMAEKDWYEQEELKNGAVVTYVPGRHFSGRLFRRQPSLWGGFALKTAHFNLFLGGDSGYDAHFKYIGEHYGPFDWALLECGQYNKNWKYIHMMPEEIVQAAKDLQAKNLFPVHWAKFSLAQHAWNEPVKRARSEAEKQGQACFSPMIGEKLDLQHPSPSTIWWE